MSCPDCTQLKAALRAAGETETQLTEVIGGLERDLRTYRIKVGRLEKQLARLEETEPEAKQVAQLLRHWKTVMGKRANTDIGPGGKRWKTAQAALKRTTAAEKQINPDGAPERAYARCLQAINGLALKPYAGPRGRSHIAYPAAKRYDDLEHCLGDEVRQQQCEDYTTDPPPERPLHEQDHWLHVRVRSLERAIEALLLETTGGDWPTRHTPHGGELAVIRATLGRPVKPWAVQMQREGLKEAA